MALQLSVIRADDLSRSSDVLADIEFGQSHEIGTDPRHVKIGLPPTGETVLVERWQSRPTVETGRYGEIAFAGDGHFLFGHVLLEESPGQDLETIGHHAYRTILKGLDDFGGLHLLRVWNYVHAINREQAGLERYRSFCVGRSRALADRSFAMRSLPAACGVGSTAPGLMISFLAAPDPGVQIENPRQVSAFRYPERYGPKSPSFSRALTYQSHLFISGTASIVGHETRHPGCALAQCNETFRNLDAVREAAGGRHRLRAARVYVRHEDQAGEIADRCRQHFGEETAIIPLESDICRRELLIEIEGFASERTASAAER